MKCLSMPNCALMYISFKNCYFLITMNMALNLNSLYYRGKDWVGVKGKRGREKERVDLETKRDRLLGLKTGFLDDQHIA